MVRILLTYALVCVFSAVGNLSHSAPLVWSGFDHTFTKPNGSDETQPEFQDRITNNVIFTRGVTQGLFNFAQESSFMAFTSPADTRWASDLNNDESATIEATNWESLSFTTWTDAFGGQFNLGNLIVGRDAVLHLISDDIYLDIRFTAWTMGPGGGFAYERAAVVPSGDFDRDGDVDADDLSIWEGGFGSFDSSHNEGDADFDGDIDGSDFLHSQRTYTGSLSSLNSSLAAVPEPASLGLLLLAGGIFLESRANSAPNGKLCR